MCVCVRICLIVLWMINYYVRSLIDKHLSFGTESISFVDGSNIPNETNINRKKNHFQIQTPTWLWKTRVVRIHIAKNQVILSVGCSMKIADIHCFYGTSRKLNDNNLLIIYKISFFSVALSVDTAVCWLSLGRLSASSEENKYKNTTRLP